MTGVAGSGQAAVHLREMTAEDLPQVVSLEKEIFTAEAWSRQILQAELDAIAARGDRRYIVAVQGQEVLGYAGIFLGDGAGDADLLALATAPAARRRGLARAMVTELVEGARRAGCRAVLLEVRESNVEAQMLYETHGFEAIGLRRRYYSAPQEDAVVMRLALRGGPGPVGAEVL